MQKKHQLIHSLVAGCLLAGLCAGVQIIRAEGASAGSGVKLPFTVFEEKGSTNNHYAPSGWIGDFKDIKMDDGCDTRPHSGKTCLRFEYSEPGEWAGVVWQDPVNDWGDQPGGWNLTGAKKLTFWARGVKGGEIVCFKFGILGLDKKYSDSATGAINDIKLTKEWKAYHIDLDGKDLTRIKSGFVWTLRGQGGPVVFFLDDIRFE
ncbi:MAG: hypothetical protein D4R79_05295 [Comamonadaceae bacterium]|nr:MAG: hypothetical protein D4R79_05295 [Comamonadaceae bacterium]